jgi:hypothetical protein
MNEAQLLIDEIAFSVVNKLGLSVGFIFRVELACALSINYLSSR